MKYGLVASNEHMPLQSKHDPGPTTNQSIYFA